MEQTHTTSDLLRLLAAEGRPFSEVAAVVAQRFGADAASLAWLGRTLSTLLRDGLLYSEAEKMNAAYLLRFVATDTAGARDALLRLSLPESGEPAGVQAWAASLATLPTHAPPSSPPRQQHPAPPFQLHQLPAQSAHAAATHDSQEQLGVSASLNALQPHQSWQGLVPGGAAGEPGGTLQGMSAAATGVPLAQQPHLWLQHVQEPAQPQPPLRGYPPQRAPDAQQSPAPQQQQLGRQEGRPPEEHHEGRRHQLSQGQQHGVWPQQQPASADQQQQPAALLQPEQQGQGQLEQQALVQRELADRPALQQQPQQHAALQQQQQEQEQLQLEQQEQQEQERRLAAAAAALQEATRTPLIPSRQQELVQGLQGPLGTALAARLAAALDGGGGGGIGLQPGDMSGLTEHNSVLAAEVLLALTRHAPAAAAVYAAAVAELPMSQQSVECLSTVVSRAELPDWVLATLFSNCMQAANASQDAGRQSRQVRLLCACVALVLQRQPAALAESLPELLSFCIQQSRYKPAAELYRQLRDLEQAVG